MTRHFGGINQRRSERAKFAVVIAIVFFLLFLGVSLVLLQSGPSNAVTTEQPVAVVTKEPPIEMVDVLVPLQSINQGDALEPAFFAREPRPKISTSSNIARSFDEIHGYYARVAIPAGQPLHRDYITKVKPTNVITANIPEGFRAVTIRVDVTSGVEGWARAGAFVDVVWASSIRGRPAITVIVQNAKILSAERDVEPNSKQGGIVPSTITLLVSAQDAQKIQLAQTTGSVSLQLRGDANSGRQEGPRSPITIDDLLPGNENAAGRPSTGAVVIMRGKDGREEKWEYKNGKLVQAEGN